MDTDGPWLRDQIRACWLLGEVERELATIAKRGADVSAFETFLPAWWNAVVLPNEAWNASPNRNGQAPRRVITKEALATLAGCAAYLDATSTTSVYRTSKEGLHNSRAALDDLTDLLQSQDLPLSEEARTYTYALIEEIRALMEDSGGLIGIDLIRRIHELQGFLASLAADLDISESGNTVAARIRLVVRKLRPVVLPVAGVAGYMLGVTADTLALTQAINPT